MEADLKIGNYSPNTQDRYLYYAEQYATYHMRSPAEMGRDEGLEWLLHQVEVLRRSPATIQVSRAAVVFLYRVTLGRELELESIPVPRQGRRVPVVLSGDEIARLIGLFRQPKYKAIVMAMYGSGLRVSEACSLRPEHIDSKRMLIRIRGKGDKERFTLLSQRLLSSLRDYWRADRPEGGWMFPGRTKQGHLSRKSVHDALSKVVKEAGFTKRVTTHTLRHSCATHLQELGTPLTVIQALLGHSQLRSTETYLHTSRELLSRTKSPLDVLGTPAAKVLG
jgi:site-specific recombinase XerD